MIHQTHLYYTAGSSDKEYKVQLEDHNGKYVVNFQYGRRYSATNGGTKTPTPVSWADARKTYERLVLSKTNKGYTTNYSGVSSVDEVDPFATLPVQEPVVEAPPKTAFDELADKIKSPKKENAKEAKEVVKHEAPKPAKTVVRKLLINTSKFKSSSEPFKQTPQLLNPIDEESCEKRLEDNRFLAQEKMDGRHQMLRKRTGKVTVLNKKGKEIGFPSQWADALKDIESITLDGEEVKGIFHAFDLLEYNGEDYRNKPCITRLSKLRDIEDLGNGIELVPYYVSTEEKRGLFNLLQEQGKEGIVFKRADAVYTPGRPNSGGDMLKHKFYATASVIVEKVNQKNSIAMALLDEEGNEVGVGNCTFAAKVRPLLKAGLVAEVRYLYAYPGGSLYQPIFKEIRDDVDQDECVMGQLKYKPA